MARLTVTFHVDSLPLKRAYIEQVGSLGDTVNVLMTDNDGRITFDFTATTRFGQASPDLRIHCQNSVVRVLDGSNLPFPSQIKVTPGRPVRDGQTIDVTSKPGHFRILQQCLDVYDTVWRQFRPFNRSSRGDFPFGKKSTLRETINSTPRVELSFPDSSPSSLAWVEPASLATSFPLIHVKAQSSDARLFGDSTTLPSLIPHEFSHALHYATMPLDKRLRLETAYGAWLASKLASGQSPFHNTDLPTDPFIAYVEAVGIFSERFFFFAKHVSPQLTGAALRNAFVDDERSSSPSLSSVFLSGDGYMGVSGLTGNNVEGAVYGAIFLDFANSVGLREAVGLYLDSQAFTFAEFQTFVNGQSNTSFTNAIDAAANNWGM